MHAVAPEFDPFDAGIKLNFDSGLLAFCEQNGQQILGRIRTKELARGFLDIFQSVALDQFDKIAGTVARQRRYAKIRIA